MFEKKEKTDYADKLVDIVLERARYEYTELCDNWKHIDLKAQGLTALAGVVLGAALAFVDKKPATLSSAELVLGAFVLIFSVLAICWALYCLRVREFMMPPDGKETWREVAGALMKHRGETRVDDLKGNYEDLKRSFVENWLDANQSLMAVNDKKGAALSTAQVFLAVALFSAAGLTMLRLLA